MIRDSGGRRDKVQGKGEKQDKTAEDAAALEPVRVSSFFRIPHAGLTLMGGLPRHLVQ